MIRIYCRAKSKRTGRQCRNLPTKGATVCKFHAGCIQSRDVRGSYDKRGDRKPAMEATGA